MTTGAGALIVGWRVAEFAGILRRGGMPARDVSVGWKRVEQRIDAAWRRSTRERKLEKEKRDYLWFMRLLIEVIYWVGFTEE
jgi:hypothetical protein